jgi:hypothetical protein
MLFWGRIRRVVFFLAGLALLCSSQTALATSDDVKTLFMPWVVQRYVPPSALSWDQRLTQRGAYLIPADVVPGQFYWRLTSARWYNEEESHGKHHIFVDTLDAAGQRQAGVPILFSWPDDSFTAETEMKPGEAYAANMPMYAIAPAYSAHPNNAPADSVAGMGLGSLIYPNKTIHTSYGLIWQWVQAR